MFTKGQPKYPGSGRQKGTGNLNRVAREIIEARYDKSLIARLLDDADIAEDGGTAIRLALMPYCYPKLAAATIEIEDKTSEAIEAEVQSLREWHESVKEDPV